RCLRDCRHLGPFPWSASAEVTRVPRQRPAEGGVASVVPRDLGPAVAAARSQHDGQVFGLTGTTTRPWSPTSRHFPGRNPVFAGDARSRSPLRGSPGLSPGSLLPRPTPAWDGRTSRRGHYILWPIPDPAPTPRVNGPVVRNSGRGVEQSPLPRKRP